MRLAYITSILLSEDDAQSIQVMAMAESFRNRLGNDFLMIGFSYKNYNFLKKINVPNKPRLLRYFLITLFSLKTVLNFKPDIIYSRDIGIVLFYYLFGYQVVYEIHKPFETFFGNLIFKLFCKKIKVVAISNTLRNYLIEKYNVKSEILVAHDGVDLDKFSNVNSSGSEELKNRILNGKGGFVVMYSGTFQSGKGIDLLLSAAQNLQSEKDIFFVLLGADQDKVVGNIIYLERKSVGEVPEYLKIADLLVLPNTKKLKYYEYTSPLKLFEYMSAGRPILSSYSGSIKEVINEQVAYFFDEGDVDSFCEKIVFIKNNYDKAEQKAADAKKLVENFTWGKRVEKIIEFLKYEKNY